MSYDKVDRILRVSKKLENRPILKAAFENGDLSLGKIDDILYITTTESEQLWAAKARTMTHDQLREEIKIERSKYQLLPPPLDSLGNIAKVTDVGNFQPVKLTEIDGSKNGLLPGVAEAGIGVIALADDITNEFRNLSIKISPQTERKLLTIKQRLERSRKETVSMGEVIEALADGAREEIARSQNKRTINRCPDCIKRRAAADKLTVEATSKRLYNKSDDDVTRYVPREIRELVLARQKYRCPGCLRPPTDLHHLDGWRRTRNHNPDRLIYLCKTHHSYIHHNDKKVQAYKITK